MDGMDAIVHTVAITNAKGGTAKTTTAVNLAAALGESGKRVLVLDLDPQGSATAWLGARSDTRALFDALTDHGDLSGLVCDVPNIRNVQLIPGSGFLMGFDKATASEPGAEALLRRAVEKLPKQWDVLLLDCPPTLGLLSISALVAARSVLVPTEATTMALAGLATLLTTVDRVRERLNPELAVLGVLACRADPRRKLTRDVMATLRERLGDRVLKTMIRENVRVAESYSFQQPVTTYAASSTGTEDHRALAVELLKRLKKVT
jgi:chromosome partitioning protein